MNYKQAAGRNWGHARRRSRPVNLRPQSERPAAMPSNVWYTVGSLKHAAGRNWTHEPLPRQLALDRLIAERSAAADHPPRERGGGDHDQPYEYRRPSARWTFPFTTLEYARLLVLKSKIDESAAGSHPDFRAA